MSYVKLLFILIFATFLQQSTCQNPSPCPQTFKYEARSTDEMKRWYGVVTLHTRDKDLDGIKLLIMLDKPGQSLGNWFGQTVSTADKTKFLITNSEYRLNIGNSVDVRFFVDFANNYNIPSVAAIMLNGRSICAQSDQSVSPADVAPGLFTSNPTKPEPSIPQDNNQATFASPVLPAPAPSRPAATPTRPRPIPSEPRPISCGTVAITGVPLIHYGTPTKKGQWPWHAAIYTSQDDQLKYICGGSLVTERHIITAGHCVTRPQSSRPVPLHDLTVYLGKYSLRKFDNTIQSRDVAGITVHPQYNQSYLFCDIAVIRMDEYVDFNDYIRPICLWDDTSSTQTENRLGTVVGWGLDQNRRISDILMETKIPIISSTTCLFSNREFYSQFLNEHNFCAGFANGTTVCNGDSGGGLVFPKPGSSAANPTWQIRGIVSLSPSYQGQSVCDPSQYAIFTDVAQHLTWVKQILARG